MMKLRLLALAAVGLLFACVALRAYLFPTPVTVKRGSRYGLTINSTYAEVLAALQGVYGDIEVYPLSRPIPVGPRPDVSLRVSQLRANPRALAQSRAWTWFPDEIPIQSITMYFEGGRLVEFVVRRQRLRL